MSHECEDCGASFDTLSGLRLHDCHPDQPADGTVADEDSPPEEAPFEDSGLDRRELETGPLSELEEELFSPDEQ